ncbi:hypothetical protein N0V90_006232 [Kalmusia sp. IMI 367209]|nr:hypothetical protein N0V90_006232 [Kalmusia sp. IMI 367209]
MVTPKDASIASSMWTNDDIAIKYALAERVTAPFAQIMVQKTSIANIEGEANVLDFACGTGAVTAALYESLPKNKWNQVHVLGGDISESMLGFLKKRAEHERWTGVETDVVDGRDIKLIPSTYTHLFVNFAIFALPPGTLESCVALLRPGGHIGISSWAYFPGWDIVRRAAARLPEPPSVPSVEEIQRAITGGRDWHSPAYVSSELRDAGIESADVVVEKAKVDCGTPEQFCDTMVLAEMKKLVEEETGGGERGFILEFEGIVATGRKLH